MTKQKHCTTLVALATLPSISVTTVVPMIVPVTIIMIAVMVHPTISSVVAGSSVLVVIGHYNAAAEQRNGRGKQYKNGLHKALLFTLRFFAAYALDCRQDVGNVFSRGEVFSYSEART